MAKGFQVPFFANLDATAVAKHGQRGYLRFNRARYEEALELFRAGCKIAEANGLRESMRELFMFCVMVEIRIFGCCNGVCNGATRCNGGAQSNGVHPAGLERSRDER